MSATEFEAAVGEALDSLPERFAAMVRNVAISIEEEPGEEDLEDWAEGGDADDELLGIYRGVALTERGHDAPMLPDEIVIFRGPINRVARDRREAVAEIRETVVHELGHYFGLDDDELP